MHLDYLDYLNAIGETSGGKITINQIVQKNTTLG